MAEEEKNLSEEIQEVPQEKAKTPWQVTKESWYDKIPLNLKQLDMIITVCWILLGLCAVAIVLDATGIYNFFR